MTAVAMTQEAVAELAAAPPSLQPKVMQAAARLQHEPEAGRPLIGDQQFPFRRLDVTDGTSIIFCPGEDEDSLLITQIAEPHRITPAICLDEAERVKAELDSDDPIRDIVDELAAVARSVTAAASA